MIFIKPDGREIEVNETSAAYAESIGWKLKGAQKAEDRELAELRQLYEMHTGKKAHHKMTVETLTKAIEG